MNIEQQLQALTGTYRGKAIIGVLEQLKPLCVQAHDLINETLNMTPGEEFPDETVMEVQYSSRRFKITFKFPNEATACISVPTPKEV